MLPDPGWIDLSLRTPFYGPPLWPWMMLGDVHLLPLNTFYVVLPPPRPARSGIQTSKVHLYLRPTEPVYLSFPRARSRSRSRIIAG